MVLNGYCFFYSIIFNKIKQHTKQEKIVPVPIHFHYLIFSLMWIIPPYPSPLSVPPLLQPWPPPNNTTQQDSPASSNCLAGYKLIHIPLFINFLETVTVNLN